MKSPRPPGWKSTRPCIPSPPRWLDGSSATHLVVGRAVQAGEVLAELDAEAPRLQYEEARVRLTALTAQRQARRQELSAEQVAQQDERQAARVALDEARARYREAEVAARAAAEQADIFVRLDARELASRLDLLRTKADADQKRAAADALRLAISRLDRDQRTKDSDRTARITQFSREVTQLDGDIRTAEATLARLAHTIDQTRVRAPITGHLGEVATLQPGAVVRQGDTLGVVLPAGALQVVASFLPAIALGRVQLGQPARLRLDGFPWAQYGSLAGTVTSVATEARDGVIRVELRLEPATPTAIPLQHGLPGTVEVEVERISPATLVLRAVGQPPRYACPERRSARASGRSVMRAAIPRPRRHLFVPEVVQTSAMDCGPAALTCLLEGHGLSVSYGRLREACQTDVDGTSIDMLETIAVQLGLHAEQILVPVDHLFLPETMALPSIVVVRLPSGVTHFVVAWRRHGRVVQVMDPGTGRRWPTCRRFLDELYVHTQVAPCHRLACLGRDGRIPGRVTPTLGDPGDRWGRGGAAPGGGTGGPGMGAPRGPGCDHAHAHGSCPRRGGSAVASKRRGRWPRCLPVPPRKTPPDHPRSLRPIGWCARRPPVRTVRLPSWYAAPSWCASAGGRRPPLPRLSKTRLPPRRLHTAPP